MASAVREIMAQTLTRCPADTTLDAAARRMRDDDICDVVVLDDDERPARHRDRPQHHHSPRQPVAATAGDLLGALVVPVTTASRSAQQPSVAN